MVAKTVKNLSAMWDTRVQSLGQKDPLEKEMVPTLQVFLPGEFHGQRSLASYSPWGHKELDTTEWLSLTQSTSGVVIPWWLSGKEPPANAGDAG